MKKTGKLWCIIAILMVIGFAACGGDTDGAYKIGDTGPGGGIVFHDKGNSSGGWRYLEVSRVNIGTIPWASSGFAVIDRPGTGAAIGTGRANTIIILNADGNAPAAKACIDYRGGGMSDWFLPSRDELNALYRARSQVGISTGFFWSSTQRTPTTAWGRTFATGNEFDNSKSQPNPVRAVRSFQ